MGVTFIIPSSIEVSSHHIGIKSLGSLFAKDFNTRIKQATLGELSEGLVQVFIKYLGEFLTLKDE
ncbi:hypothetical protein Fmac_011655 [Flemingia macrophylla]|uniref:Uncharacterized protein n=1 Tax=Flemingia macrophylla TaxID=520843 RepID=A0ABD1MN28_9FABA